MVTTHHGIWKFCFPAPIYIPSAKHATLPPDSHQSARLAGMAGIAHTPLWWRWSVTPPSPPGSTAYWYWCHSLIHKPYFSHPKVPSTLLLHPSLGSLTLGSTYPGGPSYSSYIAIPVLTPFVAEGESSDPTLNTGLRGAKSAIWQRGQRAKLIGTTVRAHTQP